jgi:chitinase
VALPSTTVVFGAGQAAKTVAVTVNGDTAFEGNEQFAVSLSSPMGATLGDSSGTGTIVDEEGPITASARDVSVVEGRSGTISTRFKVSLSHAPVAGQSVSLKVATSNGTATAGSDYVALPSTTVVFVTGQTVKLVTVSVKGDATKESNETFNLNLSKPTGAVVADNRAVATIVNDD